MHKRLNINERLFRDAFPKFNRHWIYVRFLRYVVIGSPDECWLWTGALINSYGHGQFKWDEKNIQTAHAAAYELFVGRRHGLFVLHSCDTPGCINPKHLWLGTQQQNIEDMINKGRMGKHDNSGDKNPNTKLSNNQVRKIRDLYNTGKYSEKKLARKFDTKQGIINGIVNNRSWKKI
jgi:hypothetical protein